MNERERDGLLYDKKMYELAIAHPKFACPKTTPDLAQVYEERLHMIGKLLAGEIGSEQEAQALCRLDFNDHGYFDDRGQYVLDVDYNEIGVPFAGDGKVAPNPFRDLQAETVTDEAFEKGIQQFEPMLRECMREERACRKYAIANPPTEADKAYSAWQDTLTDKEKKGLPWIDQLGWIALQIRRKRFKTLKQLARAHDQPLWWAQLVKKAVVMSGLIPEDNITKCFRYRGRPKKGKPRGPYKKKALEASP